MGLVRSGYPMGMDSIHCFIHDIQGFSNIWLVFHHINEMVLFIFIQYSNFSGDRSSDSLEMIFYIF